MYTRSMRQSQLRALSVPVSFLPRSGALVRFLAQRGSGLGCQRFRGGATFELNFEERIEAEAFVRRGYETKVCAWILRRIGRESVFLDVGANVGLISFTVARCGARVIAFEASSTNCLRWRANSALNPDVDVELVEAAVGDKDGTAMLMLGGESGWHTISPHGSLEVRQITLDDWTLRNDVQWIDVLKLDVEGYEGQVLRGAQRLLHESRIGAIVLLNPLTDLALLVRSWASSSASAIVGSVLLVRRVDLCAGRRHANSSRLGESSQHPADKADALAGRRPWTGDSAAGTARRAEASASLASDGLKSRVAGRSDLSDVAVAGDAVFSLLVPTTRAAMRTPVVCKRNRWGRGAWTNQARPNPLR